MTKHKPDINELLKLQRRVKEGTASKKERDEYYRLLDIFPKEERP
jgi:hypothetical protein